MFAGDGRAVIFPDATAELGLIGARKGNDFHISLAEECRLKTLFGFEDEDVIAVSFGVKAGFGSTDVGPDLSVPEISCEHGTLRIIGHRFERKWVTDEERAAVSSAYG